MSVYCLADFHLSNQVDKPMHKFGEEWLDHDLKIKENLQRVLTDADLLLIPGDISWAINLQEAKKDLVFISELPGKKILLRGNHDYWWGTLSKNYRAMAKWQIENIDFLQNNAFRVEDSDLGGLLIAGTRGWIFPNDPKWQKSDRKIFEREIQRLALSLSQAEKLKQPGDKLIVMTHFPPVNQQLAISEFTKLMYNHQADVCVFGHIHHRESPYQLSGELIHEIPLILTSCDQVGFQPILLDDYLKS
ncbi:MAG TPA: serine/threonine protein phosphatase [Clostridiaceae bacterium]|nr:serine/threonine protein phosphatase [Clostridiaceae bacterium]